MSWNKEKTAKEKHSQQLESSRSTALPWEEEVGDEASSMDKAGSEGQGEFHSSEEQLPFQAVLSSMQQASAHLDPPATRTVKCGTGKQPVRGFHIESQRDKSAEELDMQQTPTQDDEVVRSKFKSGPLGETEDVFPTDTSDHPPSCFSASPDSEYQPSSSDDPGTPHGARKERTSYRHTIAFDADSNHSLYRLAGAGGRRLRAATMTNPPRSPGIEIGLPINHRNLAKSVPSDEDALMISPSSPPKHQRFDLGKRFALDISHEHSNSRTPSPVKEASGVGEEEGEDGETTLDASGDDIFHMSHSKSPLYDDEKIESSTQGDLPPLLDEYVKSRFPMTGVDVVMQDLKTPTDGGAKEDDILQFSFSTKSSSTDESSEVNLELVSADEEAIGEKQQQLQQEQYRPPDLVLGIEQQPISIPIPPPPPLTPISAFSNLHNKGMPKLNPLHQVHNKTNSESASQRQMPKLSPIPQPGAKIRSMPQLKPLSFPDKQHVKDVSLNPHLYQMPTLRKVPVNGPPLPKLTPLVSNVKNFNDGRPKVMPKLFRIGDTGVHPAEVSSRPLPRLYPIHNPELTPKQHVATKTPTRPPKVIVAAKFTPEEASRRAGFCQFTNSASTGDDATPKQRSDSEGVLKPHPSATMAIPSRSHSEFNSTTISTPEGQGYVKSNQPVVVYAKQPMAAHTIQPTFVPGRDGEGGFPCYYSGDLHAAKNQALSVTGVTNEGHTSIPSTPVPQQQQQQGYYSGEITKKQAMSGAGATNKVYASVPSTYAHHAHQQQGLKPSATIQTAYGNTSPHVPIVKTNQQRAYVTSKTTPTSPLVTTTTWFPSMAMTAQGVNRPRGSTTTTTTPRPRGVDCYLGNTRENATILLDDLGQFRQTVIVYPESKITPQGPGAKF